MRPCSSLTGAQAPERRAAPVAVGQGLDRRAAGPRRRCPGAAGRCRRRAACRSGSAPTAGRCDGRPAGAGGPAGAPAATRPSPPGRPAGARPASPRRAGRQQLVALPVGVGRVLGQLVAGGGHGRRTWGTGRRSRRDGARRRPRSPRAPGGSWLRQSRSPHWNSRAPADAGASTRRGRWPGVRAGRLPSPAPRRAPRRPAARCPRRPWRRGRAARRPRAPVHRRQRARQRRVAGRLALEEDAVAAAALAHHPAAVVAHHRVLQAGEDVVAAEAVAERLGGDVGHEHRAGLAQVGRPGASAPPARPNSAMSSSPWAMRLLLEERARAGAADAVHVGVDARVRSRR